jgi:H+/gluconate symporter-like permease
MIGILGTGLALCLLIYLSYRGLSVLLVAPLMALLAVALSGTPVLASYTQVFMPALGSFLVQYFPLFLLGAVFGKLMDDSGAARALAEAIVSRLGPTMTIPAIVLACSVLTYGGVSLFVVAFAAYPIAAQMFERARIARSLIPASIALGAFTFTMTALPGTPSIQNAIPMPYFGTTAFAAPGLGLIAGTIMAGGGLAWLIWRSQMSSAKFAPETRTTAPIANEARPDDAACALPPVYQAALPVALVVALNYLFSVHILPALDTSHLAEERFGAIGFASVRGTWSILSALSISIVVLLLLNRHRLKKPAPTLDEGLAPCLCRHSRLCACDCSGQPARFPCRIRQYFGRHHRFRIGRNEYRAASPGRHLSRSRHLGRDRSRSSASGDGACHRRAGCASTQWRRHHPARRVQDDPGRGLQGYLRRRLRHTDRGAHRRARNRGTHRFLLAIDGSGL